MASGATLGADEAFTKAQAHFKKADNELNAVWSGLKKKLSAAEYTELQNAQREWLAHRDYMAGWAANLDGKGEGKEKTSAEYWTASAYLTEERTKFLRVWNAPYHEGWDGEWMDSYGGSLRIVEDEKSSIHFSIHVVRGPTSHTGALAGVARMNGKLARFTDVASAPDKAKSDGPAWLTFIRRGSRLEIVGANTQYYHGARAYFDGVFIRVGDLDSKAKAEVKKQALEPVE